MYRSVPARHGIAILPEGAQKLPWGGFAVGLQDAPPAEAGSPASPLQRAGVSGDSGIIRPPRLQVRDTVRQPPRPVPRQPQSFVLRDDAPQLPRQLRRRLRRAVEQPPPPTAR